MGTYHKLRANSREYIENNPQDPRRYDHIQVKLGDTSQMPDWYVGDKMPAGFTDGTFTDDQGTYVIKDGILVSVEISDE